MESGLIIAVATAVLSVVSVFLGAKYRKWQSRGRLRRTILELLTNGTIHYTDLDKKICATSHAFVTTNTLNAS